MRILIVEDNPEINRFLKNSLQREAFAVDSALDGEQGSFLARTNDYDLIILDNVLPKKLGREICRELRALGKTMPVLILSVQSEVPDKIELLDMGADDYLTKPFSFAELLARVRALLRRPAAWQNDVVQIEDLIIDIPRHRVTRNSQEIYLTRKEFELLEYLVRNRGLVLSRGMIMEHVWDINGDVFSNTIETHILNLRKKVDRHSPRKLIHTIPSRGYKVDVSK